MKYGLLGEKLKHSFSPQIHNAFGIDDYILKALASDEIIKTATSEKDLYKLVKEGII